MTLFKGKHFRSERMCAVTRRVAYTCCHKLQYSAKGTYFAKTCHTCHKTGVLSGAYSSKLPVEVVQQHSPVGVTATLICLLYDVQQKSCKHSNVLSDYLGLIGSAATHGTRVSNSNTDSRPTVVST